jgi:predicted glycosyltransferase
MLPIKRIGIFLGKSSQLINLEQIINSLKKYQSSEILLRMHPNTLFQNPSKIVHKYPSIILSKNSNVEQDIQSCDFILAGNTTVHLKCLLHGVVSMYCYQLEPNHFDRNKYIENGLIIEYSTELSLEAINSHYAYNDKITYYLNTNLSTSKAIHLYEEYLSSL